MVGEATARTSPEITTLQIRYSDLDIQNSILKSIPSSASLKSGA